MEYLFALSSLPDYEIVIWSWKNGDKLASQKTGVISLHQSFRCSPISPPVICQMAEDSKEIVFWEVHTCYKKCLLTRINFEIDTATPPCRITWSPDGILFVVDSKGLFFMVEIDKRKLQYIFSWTSDHYDIIPCISWYKGGIVGSGPDGTVKHLKRTGTTEWEIAFAVIPDETFTTIATCIGKDHLITLTNTVYPYW
ncbi:hypothetical protein C0J52_09304 [Blattella germanica]|nr:hypothetical protein C0J52_09304 [Blattella germanica]